MDESTDKQDTAQLLIFIRGIDKDFSITEELLGLESMKGTTTGRSGSISMCSKLCRKKWLVME